MPNKKCILGVTSWFVVTLLATSTSIVRSSPPMAGGTGPIDIHDPYIQGLACWSVGEMDAVSTSAYQQAPLDVVSGTRQVVAGTLYVLTIRVVETTTLKGANNPGSCHVRNNAEHPKVCLVTILDQPWLNKKTLTSWSCR